MKHLLKTPHFIGKKKAERRVPAAQCMSRRCSFERMEPREMLAADFLAGPGGDFGQPGGPVGRVSGSVFAVQSNSCGPHDNATSLAGVRILLTDSTGNVILETITDEHGGYDFPDLLPGTYSITQIPPLGFLGTQSHVGGGGGLSLNANRVDHVEVEAGLESQGYDFCDFDVQSFNENIQVAAQSLAAANVPLQIEPSAMTSAAFVFDHFDASAASDPVYIAPPKTFVSSFHELPTTKTEAIEEWDNSPFETESEFAAGSFLELASTTLPAAGNLESLPEDSRINAEGRDALFADGYTVKSLEWWEEESLLKLDQLMGDAEIIQLENEPTAAAVETTAVTKVARRQESQLAE